MATFEKIQQHILPASSYIAQDIMLYRIPALQTGDILKQFSHDAAKRGDTFSAIGVAYTISSTGYIDTLALADSHSIFCVDFHQRPKQFSKDFKELLAFGGAISATDRREWSLVGFSFARTSVQVHQATGLRVRGVDLSTLFSRDTWKPDHPAAIVQKRISKSVDLWSITSLWTGPHSQDNAVHQIALQSWLAANVAKMSYIPIATATKVDSTFLSTNELRCLSQMVAQSDLLESHAPREIHSEFTSAILDEDGKYMVNNSRYKTRIRRSGLAQVVMTDADGGKHVGSANRTVGRQTHISFHKSGGRIGQVSSIKVIGKSEPTNSERSRDEMIHLLLTGTKRMRTSGFMQTLWFPMNQPIHRVMPVVIGADTTDSLSDSMRLNSAQRCAVKEMIGQQLMTVIHGPPGTGKTTTIAAAAKIWSLYSCPVWIVAHSNVAVKNIAETLFKKNVEFRLLVSKEFYDEWHEHLYTEVVHWLIRSDELPSDAKEMRLVLGSSRIMLCTLSMLSNPALQQNGTFEVVPLQRLIVDEASQINAFEFMHIFQRFQKTLEKVIFVGDPKQLPPFGRDSIKAMRTIFDFESSLGAGSCLFLDTQYRMPTRVGEFISKVIYGGRLQSQHSVTSYSCVAFIDIPPPRGLEQKQGVSWKNQGELDTVVNLVNLYYKTQNFCVITPYDAQRAAIQRSLQAAGLPSDAVYNVDSFQGNEADYVLVSVVRSSDQPGFLVSENRMNVLLTRCRKGMVIVSSRQFLAELGGARTVLGHMHRHWVGAYNATWVDWRYVSSGVADLPGAPGPNRTSHKQVAFGNLSPSTHSGCGSGPNAWSMYRPAPHTSHNVWINPVGRSILADGERIHSISGGPVPRLPMPDTGCSVEFPPLTITKQPILPGTWGNLQVKQNRLSNVVSEYSFVHKRRAASINLANNGGRSVQKGSGSSAQAKGSVGAATNPRKWEAPSLAPSASAPAQRGLLGTNIYRRRH